MTYDPAIAGDSLKGVKIISKEAGRLTGMVEELLEFTRIQDGRFNLRIELMDITAELEDALFTYEELLRQAGIEVNYAAPEYVIPLIPGDPERQAGIPQRPGQRRHPWCRRWKDRHRHQLRRQVCHHHYAGLRSGRAGMRTAPCEGKIL